APADPVVSAKTGRVYERRLLQKYLDENGHEPQTDHELESSDIIAINSEPPTVKPRPPTLTSIPAMLSAFQNEWDALVLETFTLKQQYQQVRQELSQALYQNDAACRVAARLLKERDEARETLAVLQAQAGVEAPKNSAPKSHAANSDMDLDDAATATEAGAGAAGDEHSPEEAYYAKAAETAKALSKTRVKREVPTDLTTADAWKTAAESAVVEALHSSTKPGILCLDTDKSGDFALTGGMDNHAEIYSRDRDQTLVTLKGHTKKITAAVWVGGGGLKQRIVTGSADKSIRIWGPKAGNASEDSNARQVGWTKDCIIKHHAAEIAGLAVHPCGEYFASASTDGSWAIHTMAGATVFGDRIESPITKIAFHPDGMFLGIGTGDGYAKILDVKQRQVLATLDVASTQEGADAAVNDIHFSENGYHLVTTSVRKAMVWDLRNQKCAHSWTPSDVAPEGGADSPSTAAFAAGRFDASGKYLALAAGQVLVFKVKGWHQLAALPVGELGAQAIAWCGPLSGSLAAAAPDNALHYFGPA
ncbi:hypothetical protein H4R19_004074, partial [Coemansia spiralis]